MIISCYISHACPYVSKLYLCYWLNISQACQSMRVSLVKFVVTLVNAVIHVKYLDSTL